MSSPPVSPPGYLPLSTYMTTDFTGGILIGAFFAVALTGFVGHMTYVYFDRFPNDRPIFRWTVGFLMFVNLLHTAFFCVYMYQCLIDGFGVISTLTDLKWGLTASFTLGAVVACVVQFFYAYRCWALLNRNLIAPAAIAIFALAGLVFGIYLTVRTAQIYIIFPQPAMVQAISWLFSLSYATPAMADLIIVGSMSWGLYRTKKLELPSNSWKAIRKVLFYAIETNLITTLLCISSIAAYATAHRPISWAICFCLPKMYGITLVSSLLARQASSSGIKGDYDFDASDSTSASSPTLSRRSNAYAARGVRIACTTQTVVENKDGLFELVEKDGRRAPLTPPMPAHVGDGPEEHRIHWSPSSSLEKKDSIDDVTALSYV